MRRLYRADLRVAVFVVVVATVMFSSSLCHAGKLSSVRSAVAGDEDRDSYDRGHSGGYASNSCPSDWDRDDDDPDDILGAILGCLISSAIESAFDSDDPKVVQAGFEAEGFEDSGVDEIDVDLSPPQDQYFRKYPYHHGASGSMGQPDWTRPPKETGARIGVEYGSNFSDLDRFALSGVLESSLTRFGVDGQWNYYFEDQPQGGNDELHLGDLNLTFRFFSTDILQARAGVGLNWIVGDQGDGGVNLTMNFSFFPIRPLVFRGELDIGHLGEASVFHGATTAGLMWDRCEIFIGYDYRKIDDVRLIGALTGVNLWF